MVNIRAEGPADIPQVRHVNELAFEAPAEAGIVDALREDCPDVISLVAEDDETVVGHIFFSPAVVDTAQGPVTGMGLAPMGVLPDRQRQGIGSQLVEAGLDMLRERHCPFVIVLGHPAFYSRFGFEAASTYGLSCQWDGVPDEAFMVIVMDHAAMQGVSGVAVYRDEFSAAM